MLFVGLLGLAVAFNQSQNVSVEQVLIDRGMDSTVLSEQLSKKVVGGLLDSSIDYPARISVAQAESQSSQRGIVASAGTRHLFYSFDLLSRYEVINDSISGQPILVAFCATCETAVIASRVLGGASVYFEATDALWDGALVLESRGGGSRFWASASGKELVVDEALSKDLTFLPFDISTLGEFSLQYPEGLVVE